MTEIKLTPTERLILSNQYEIMSMIDKDNESDYKLSKKIVDTGIEGMYSHIFNNISSKTIKNEVVSETLDILDMYRLIGHQLDSSKIEGVDRIKFKGFDANHDDHYYIMSTYVEDMNRYDEHKDTYYNSHGASSLSTYRRLLSKMKELNLGFNQISEEQILELIKSV